MTRLQKANIAVPITASNAHVQKAGLGASIEAFGDPSELHCANGSFGLGSTGVVRDPVSNAYRTGARGARGLPVQEKLDPAYLGDEGISILDDFVSTARPLDAFDNSGSPGSEPSRHLRAGVGVGTEIDQDVTEIRIMDANVERGGILELSTDVRAACGLSPKLKQPRKLSVVDTSSGRLEARNHHMPGADTSGARLALDRA